MYASFNSARVADTPADAAAAQLYVRLLQDAVNEYTYPALLAGLNFSIYTHSRGISIRVSGYDDKQRVLLQRIVQSIDKLEVDPRRFENIRADMVRELENVKTGRAFQQAAGDARELLLSGRWNEDALIAELQALDPDAVLRFAEGFWPSTEVDLMLNGNYLPADVEWVTRALQPLLPRDGELAPASVAVTRLNGGDNFVYRAPIEHDDAVVFWYLQGPGDDVQNRALAALTGQIIGTRFFEDLRTEQQLGYVVGAFYWPQLDVPGVAMMVQSPEASVPEVIAAAEQFLAGVAEDESVSPEQFQRHQQALLQDILQPHKNLWEQSEYFWQEIAQDRFDFDSRQRLAEQVSAATLAQWRDWYRQVMLDERASLLVAAPGKSGAMPPGTAVEDPVVFRNQRPVYRSERPTYRNPGS
jgi:secreted Zn-dependent insulinase-like peptidase